MYMSLSKLSYKSSMKFDSVKKKCLIKVLVYVHNILYI